MSGVVFHQISEGIMAQDIKRRAGDARDSLSVLMPEVKDGNLLAADYVLKHLAINPTTNWSSSLTSNPIWGKAKTSSREISLTQSAPTPANVVPDVEGMGARDAVYALEHRGVKVYVEGRGKVISQSLPPGHVIKKGDVCRLKFDI